jgi:predicted PurR-regulated permease PerM
MELDDFKQVWQTATEQLPHWSAEQLQTELKQKIRRSSQSIYKRILGESAVGVLLIILTMWFLLQKNNALSHFFHILISSVAVFSLFPIIQGIRAWQAEKKINFAENFLQDTEKQYKLLKNTFTVHLWASYIITVCAIIVTFLDSSLNKVMPAKIFLLIYFILFIIFAKFYLNWLYGKRINQLKKLIEELEEATNSVK